MKTAKIRLDNIKSSDGWGELAFSLLFEKFEEENKELDEEDAITDKFYTEVISKTFEYGEYASLEIIFDEKLNIVGGKIIKFE